MINVEPVTLTGRVVRLEPLSEAHVPDLTLAGHYENIWTYMLYVYPDTEAKMLLWVRDMLNRRAAGTDMPFAVIHLESGKAIGATRYLEIRPQHNGLEIGGTWYTPMFQRTAVNTECKYLLMTHAFETLKCIRVQIKTDLRNERSQKAIERIGAKREGVLRNHLILSSGLIRDSVYYSVLDSEWGEVKAKLEEMLRR